jgi:signal transduction histidine kinase
MLAGRFSPGKVPAEPRARNTSLVHWLAAAALGLAAVVMSAMASPGLPQPTLLIGILAVLLSALDGGRIAGWIAFTFSVAGFLWLQRSTYNLVNRSGEIILLVTYVAVCAVLVEIVHHLRDEWRKLSDRERRLAEAAETLRASERLATTGRLAATISHELTNPLESVQYLLYAVNQRANLSREDRENLRAAESEVTRMGQLVKQTLGLHRQGDAPAPVNLTSLLKGILLLYGRILQAKKISLKECYDFEGAVTVFPAEIRQVLSNLIVNAVDAMDEGGQLTLHVRQVREWRYPRREGALVTIIDNGSGIKKETRDRMFEPFFTTKGEKGTGLGLWVSRGIIQKHKGWIRVRSSDRPGRSYTCFSVFLPLALEPHKVPQLPQAA